jgi:hypothetical protein
MVLHHEYSNDYCIPWCVDYLVIGITSLRNDVRGVLGLSEIVIVERGGNFKTRKTTERT